MGELSARAARGDQDAWRALVRCGTPRLRATARRYGLSATDAEDVCQETWLALARYLPAIREPACVPAWLATTARRQAQRKVMRRDRDQSPPWQTEDATALGGVAPSAEALALRAERNRAFWRAVARMTERRRRLMHLLVLRPELTHAELAVELGVAPGSIGPLRTRSFAELRLRLRAEGVDAADLP
ncbi:RNA polymerase sigma factor [Amycolatopsis arida]|nr:sigma-70 family RNA polymerase sigma factor [Amycolatopsis arida]